MNDHPRELLPLIAEGALPDEEVRAHLNECGACRTALTAISPLDLDYAWDGIAAELDAPHTSVAERALTRVGMDASLARFVVCTPTLRGSWLLASLLVVGFALAGTTLAPQERLSPVLVVAPLIAAGFVAFAYGSAADPVHEIVASTPLSPLIALLIRLAAVLAWNSSVVAVADFVAGSERGSFAWFLPMACVALLAAAVGVRTQPVVGAACGMGVWMTLVIAATSAAHDPAHFLWGRPAQVAYASAVAVLLGLLSRWVVEGRGFVVPVAFGRTDGGAHAS